MKSFTFVALLGTALAREGLGEHLGRLFLNLKDDHAAVQGVPSADSVVVSSKVDLAKYADKLTPKEETISRLDKYLAKLTPSDLNVNEPRMVINKPAAEEMMERLAKAKETKAGEMLINAGKAAASDSVVVSKVKDALKSADSVVVSHPKAEGDSVVVSHPKAEGDSVVASHPKAEADSVVVSHAKAADEVVVAKAARGGLVADSVVSTNSKSVKVFTEEEKKQFVERMRKAADVIEPLSADLYAGDGVVVSNYKSAAKPSLRAGAAEKMKAAVEEFANSHTEAQGEEPVMVVNVKETQ